MCHAKRKLSCRLSQCDMTTKAISVSNAVAIAAPENIETFEVNRRYKVYWRGRLTIVRIRFLSFWTYQTDRSRIFIHAWLNIVWFFLSTQSHSINLLSFRVEHTLRVTGGQWLLALQYFIWWRAGMRGIELIIFSLFHIHWRCGHSVSMIFLSAYSHFIIPLIT